MSWEDVRREEWKTLTPVPPQMWGVFNPKTSSYQQNTLGLCDGCRTKNQGHYFLQTQTEERWPFVEPAKTRDLRNTAKHAAK